jgi:diguanylate cyclase (GGDEF)-like protein
MNGINNVPATTTMQASRSHFSARLHATLALLFVPIALLSALVYFTSTREIEETERERAGFRYVSAIWPVFYGTTLGDQQPTATQIATIEAEAASHDARFGTGEASRELLAALRDVHGFQAQRELLAARLIDTLAERSGLVLDRYLPTYPLLDMLVTRLPELARHLRTLRRYLEHAAAHGPVLDSHRAAFLRQVGRFSATHESIEAAWQSTLRHGPAQTPRLDGQGALSEAMRRLETDLHHAQRLMLSAADRRNAELAEVAAATATQAAGIGPVWEALAAELDLRFAERLVVLRQDLWTLLSISIGTVAVALVLAAALLRGVIRKIDQRVAYLSQHDRVTRLKNRDGLLADLGAALTSGDQRVVLHCIDVDQFQRVTRTYGHVFADRIIQVLAQRLARAVRRGDSVARLDQDTFMVVQSVSGPGEDAREMARRFREIVAEPIVVDNTLIKLTASVGVASATAGGDAAQLMGQAETAVRSVVAGGRGEVQVYDPALDGVLRARREVEALVRAAAETNGFELHYQAIYCGASRRLKGFEALLRLPRPDGGYLSPAVFIPVAEDLELVGEIGAWVLRRACATAALWPEGIRIAVNLSPLQFQDNSLVGLVAQVLRETGLPASRLQLEITEGLLLDDSVHIMAQLNSLKALGVSIAMDDFGVGYSSLGYLSRFPFDKIKIDKSFVQAVGQLAGNERNHDASIVASIIALGRELGLTVTAEGVETEAQAAFLKGLDCDEVQGFLMARPVPAPEVAQLLARDAELGHDLLSHFARPRLAANVA